MIMKDNIGIDELYNLLSDSFPYYEIYDKSHFEKLFSNENYNVNAYYENRKLVGIATWWRFENNIYLEHLAVDKKYRGNGYGSVILTNFIHSFTKPVILECEPPLTETARRRIDFYTSNGMLLNYEYEYVNPPMRKDAPGYDLVIMSSRRYITEDEFIEWRENVKNKVYGCLVLD